MPPALYRDRVGHITRKPIYRTEITDTEAECTETKNFGRKIGLHVWKTEIGSVNSALTLGQPNTEKKESRPICLTELLFLDFLAAPSSQPLIVLVLIPRPHREPDPRMDAHLARQSRYWGWSSRHHPVEQHARMTLLQVQVPCLDPCIHNLFSLSQILRWDPTVLNELAEETRLARSAIAYSS